MIRENLNIDLELLTPLRRYMTDDQLARFGDYSAHRQIVEPFTWPEIADLIVKSYAANNYAPPFKLSPIDLPLALINY
jgi:hypothetical protein